MIQSNFRSWDLDSVDDTFGTRQVQTLPSLTSLLAFDYTPDDYERRFLTELRDSYLLLGGDAWNEVELENKFISPLIVQAKISNERFSYFLERPMSVEIGEYVLSGRVDGMIATGFRNPKKPYFCLAEYKRQTDPDGDPSGQTLIAMLAAQALNNNQFPIYGCYIIGRSWYFMSLEDRQYAISNVFTSTDEELFDIFRILRGLRWHIEQLLDRPQIAA